MNQETFSRKEVRALLKRQIRASANSYGKMEVPKALFRNSAYADENIQVHKRLANVKIIKF